MIRILFKIFVTLVLIISMNHNVLAQKSMPTSKGTSSVVTVKIVNNNQSFSHVDLINAYGSESEIYASADIKDDQFTMNVNLRSDIYRFDFGSQNYFLVVIKPGENIKLTIDAENLQEMVSASGSASMAFVKEASSLSNRKKVVLDSLNNALQNDPKQKYWSKQAQSIHQYVQTNADIDRYILSVFDNVDTLKAIMEHYVKNGKIKTSDLDVFTQVANKTLKDFDKNYRPFANYLENVDNYYDFSDKGSVEYDEYYTLRKSCISEADARYERAERFLGKQMPVVTRLLAVRDSLVYNDLMLKGKNKAEWAMSVYNAFSPVVDEIAVEHVDWKNQWSINREVPQNLSQMAQGIVKDIVASYQEQYNENDSYLNSKLMELVREHKNDLAVLMFLDIYPREQYSSLHEEVIKALHEVDPEHPIVKERWNYMQSAGYKTSIGTMAPELEFPDPDGNIRRLSDLKGHVVIVDFWASWCGPCRRENPNVRRIYAQYHDKGLEIFSVSLDRDASSWKKAIVDDKLVWPNHVSDLKQWQSQAAAIYGVRSIPATFILDREGRIVAKDLRGQDLENAVKRLLEN